MPQFKHDDLLFHYREAGEGIAFVFQHGLGGDTGQTFGIFRQPRGIRLVTLDCRAHGKTHPVGAAAKISIASYADDLVRLLDHLSIERAVLGGISMGSAIALNVALRYPDRMLGLVLSRAAWLCRPRRYNVRVYSRIAGLIRRYGPQKAEEAFRKSRIYRSTRRIAPESADSLLRQFRTPDIDKTFIKFERITRDSPCQDLKELAKIEVPTLVLANRRDPVHPFKYGKILAAVIPHAEFREITSKSASRERHAADVQRFITAFIQLHFGIPS